MINWFKIKQGANGLHFPKRNVLLHFLISSAGKSILRDHNYSFYGLERGNEEFAVFQYTLKGRGTLCYEGENYALTEGTAMLVHIPHDHHYYFPRDSESWEFVYICFYGSELLRIFAQAEKSLGPVMKPGREDRLLEQTYKILNSVMGEGEEKNVFHYSSLAYEWIMALAENIKRDGGGEEPSAVRKTRQYCRDNLHKPIGVEDMARAARCSRSHLTRLFSVHIQMGLQEYLEYLRMQKACRLLHNEKYTVKEVARLCGYGDENYFCKVFKKNFARSPGRYREIGL